MGNDLDAIRNSLKEEIETKINNTGNEVLNFSKEEMKITQLSCHEVQKLILDKEKSLSLPFLFNAFHFAKQQEMNSHCSMTDVFYFEPLSRAYKLQRSIDFNDKEEIEKFPLLGFVFSIKEYINIKGSRSTWGVLIGLNKFADENPKLIDFITSKGALIVCKGNVPQLLMIYESTNNLFGNCSNPTNSLRVSGGSSGGEAASIALGLVNVGIGSDIGGSIRVPSLFCGIYGFKPTAGRVDDCDAFSCLENTKMDGKTGDNQYVVEPTIGPMGKSARDCTTVMKVLIEFSLTKTDLPPVPWREANNPMRVGIISEFSPYLKQPDCCTRALHEASLLLKQANVQIVPINLNHVSEEILVNTLALFFMDKEFREILLEETIIKEPLTDGYSSIMELIRYPLWILQNLSKSDLMSARDKLVIKAAIISRTSNQISIKYNQTKIVRSVLKEFEKAKIDVALAYGLIPAPLIGKTAGLEHYFLYTYCWNFLNFPAGAVPMTTVYENEQFYEGELNDSCDHIITDLMKDSKGLPIGIQVVGVPWKDELVLKTMELIEELKLKKNKSAVTFLKRF